MFKFVVFKKSTPTLFYHRWTNIKILADFIKSLYLAFCSLKNF
ncbi:hypothetical protein HMPREF1253_0438 [Peptoniphilus sp. BV3C26]|nr:hypothetical protein HMPREF1253_0438 [Peptoniphilus sp. BV3C26]